MLIHLDIKLFDSLYEPYPAFVESFQTLIASKDKLRTLKVRGETAESAAYQLFTSANSLESLNYDHTTRVNDTNWQQLISSLRNNSLKSVYISFPRLSSPRYSSFDLFYIDANFWPLLLQYAPNLEYLKISGPDLNDAQTDAICQHVVQFKKLRGFEFYRFYGSLKRHPSILRFIQIFDRDKSYRKEEFDSFEISVVRFALAHPKRHIEMHLGLFCNNALQPYVLAFKEKPANLFITFELDN